ncbi:hypothetical protein ACSLFT_09195 [Streptomyces sp. G6]|uniref:hypothetical protein n=1 Tax=Streptomyces sp. G6 TaxID=1178736 RepID=UPI003ED8F776
MLPQTSAPGADLTAQFPSTPRGAQLARHHAVRWLEALGHTPASDAATDRRPPTVPPSPCPEGESGRGLLLVDVLALRWGWTPRRPLGKTVWAELPLKPTEETTPDA